MFCKNDLLNKNDHLIFFSQPACLIVKVKPLKKIKNRALQNFHPKLVIKALYWAVAAQTWAVCWFFFFFFYPKLHLTTAYQPLISATFSPLWFLLMCSTGSWIEPPPDWCKIVLENSANIFHYPTPPQYLFLSSPPFLCWCLSHFHFPAIEKVKSRTIGNQVEY